MRHIAEGELHAYLDGGLETFPESEARRVRAHLEICEPCRERLRVASQLRERTADLLESVAPEVGSAPALEELRRAARGRGRIGSPAPGGSPRSAPLVAAVGTVILATGIGWMVGRVGASATTEHRTVPIPAIVGKAELPEFGMDASNSADGSRSVTRSVPDGSRITEEGAGTARTELPTARRGDSLRAPPSLTVTLPPSVGEDEGEGSPSVATVATEVLGPLPLPTPSPASDDRSTSTGPEAALGRGVELRDSSPRMGVSERNPPQEGREEAPISARDAPARTSASTSALSRDGLGAELIERLALGGTSMEERLEIERILAERGSEPSPDAQVARRMIIPRLRVVSVEWTEVAPDVQGLRVVQRLVTDDTIELRFGGMTGDVELPEYLLRERLPDGIHQVAESFQEGWVVARAPLEEEQIRALVALIVR